MSTLPPRTWLKSRQVDPARIVATTPPPKIRLNEQDRALAIDIAGRIKDGHPTPFAAEGWVVFSIRHERCLKGWPYALADTMARAIFNGALQHLGISRPPWEHGQPEWVHPTYTFRERTRCIRCGWKLPDGRPTYCSDLCRKNANAETYASDRRAELAALQRRYRAEWSAQQPERPCVVCGTPFKPTSPSNPDQKTCSVSCRNRLNSKPGFGDIIPRRTHAA